jgi:F-type H+-transporting ATPase subunit delta
MLGRIFGGKASTEVLNFLKVLSRHDRLGILRQAARLVKKMHAERRGMTDVEVRVATPLDDAMLAEIQNQLRKSFATEPVLNVKVDPSLIAGIVIRVGDRVYDGSVHSQLERTRAAIIQKATEQIESRPDSFMVA